MKDPDDHLILALIFLTVVIGFSLVVFAFGAPPETFPFKNLAQLATGTPEWAIGYQESGPMCQTVLSRIELSSTKNPAERWIVFLDTRFRMHAGHILDMEVFNRPDHLVWGRVDEASGRIVIDRSEPFQPGVHKVCGAFPAAEP